MHAAPAVGVRSGGAGLWHFFGLLVPALAAASLAAWVLAHAQQDSRPALLLVPVVAAVLWLLFKPQAFAFGWDGQRWLSVGPVGTEQEGRLDVMLDLGPWLLLRWCPVDGRGARRWVSVRAGEAQPNLHALRAAVYCRRPEPTPGTRAASVSRPAAEPD